MQVIYHGSYCKEENPNLDNKYNKDFGNGFYCTILKDQAIKWANKYNTKFVNLYEYHENKDLKIKKFGMMTDEWLDFIINSRKGKKHDYDIVVGAMVNNQIYNYLNALIDGEITRSAFWELVKYKFTAYEMAFCTKKSLETLKFIGAEEI